MIFFQIPNKRTRGISIIEVMIALVIFMVVATTAFMVMGNIHVQQNKLDVAQDFYSESRFLMERMVQMVRNNTIDYDRYFLEKGPGITCENFNSAQLPEIPLPASPCTEDNTSTNRACIGYENVFYWKDSATPPKFKNMGGKLGDGSGDDPCTQAFAYSDSGTVADLYLINPERTVQTAIRLLSAAGEDPAKVQLQTRLGADTNGDGKADVWHPYSKYESNTCKLYSDEAKTIEVTTLIGDTTSQDFCNRAHDWTDISPTGMSVTSLDFVPQPNRDPFLAFRIDDAQVHPFVFIRFNAELFNPQKYGLDLNQKPSIILQTTASSRVYGDTRE